VTAAREQSLAWAYDGAAHLRALTARMGDDAFTAPSGLPSWTRAHVLSHIARNADAMVNLLNWARTGVRTPAYLSWEQRDADIAAGATRAPAQIREDLVVSSDRLAAVVRAMPEAAWNARVAHPSGVEIAAGVVPWLRAREMWIHAVDLDVGASFTDLPLPMLVALVDEVAARGVGPHARLVATDAAREWVLGAAQEAEPEPGVISGPVAELVAWLLGRSTGRALRTADGRRPPPAPRWPF